MSRSKRLEKCFCQKKKLLSIFLTAGYPNLEDTIPLCQMLENEGVDFLEIGFPYSDPLADGVVIQDTSEVALANGMTLVRLLSDLKELRKNVSIPILWMGYFNPVLQYGVENFLKAISEVGVDGCILPDLPLLEYNSKYKALFEKYSLDFIPLITPTTPDKRYPEIEAASSAFIYAVSSTAVTGGSATTQRREDYFEKLGKMSKPVIVGFGIATKADFELATKEAAGAIVGSAFLKALKKESPIESGKAFVKKLM